ncbi:MAG: hypothetical protein J4F28_08790 [Nitrosopumilaceae archaeon]|nr:hypothetical protein [Nitrosopumilaceae archaeon]
MSADCMAACACDAPARAGTLRFAPALICHGLRGILCCILRRPAVTIGLEPASYRCGACGLILMGDLREVSGHVYGEHGGTSFAFEGDAMGRGLAVTGAGRAAACACGASSTRRSVPSVMRRGLRGMLPRSVIMIVMGATSYRCGECGLVLAGELGEVYGHVRQEHDGESVALDSDCWVAS